MSVPEGVEWDIDRHLEDVNTVHQSGEIAKDLFAGTVGGMAQVLCGQPFDTTKVRLQSAPPGRYTGAVDAVRQLVQNEGFGGFYKGTLTPLLGVGACVSVQFAVNEAMKRFFHARNTAAGSASEDPSLRYSQLYVGGAVAGLANSVLASPIEHIRIRLQVQTGTRSAETQFSGPVDAIRQIYRLGGVRNIFRGFGPTLIREAHGMGIYFLAAEACIKQDVQINGITRADVPSWRVCVYGGLAGMSMWITSYPIDVLKSRMQTDDIRPDKKRFQNMRDCWRATVATGYRGLWRGFCPTLVRAAPVNAATFYAFDITRNMLG